MKNKLYHVHMYLYIEFKWYRCVDKTSFQDKKLPSYFNTIGRCRVNNLDSPLNYWISYRITPAKLRTCSFINNNCKWKKSYLSWKTTLISNNSFQITLAVCIHGTEIQLHQQEATRHFFFYHVLTTLPNVIIHKCLWKDGRRREQERSESFYILLMNNLFVWFK